MLDDLCEDWENGDCTFKAPVREIDLKFRQPGISTLIAALFFLDTINHPNTHTVIIAHDGESTEVLFSMVQRFQENLSPDKQRATRHASKRELDFADIGSTYRVLTAGTKTSGRSRTVHNLHCSEVPFWPDPSIVTGLLQAVPAGGNIFIESTANGKDDIFYPEYQKAKKGESRYRARFMPWWMHAEYQTEPEPDLIPTTFEDEERNSSSESGQKLFRLFGDESGLARKYRLSLSQLQWRRNKILEPGMGHLFAQEYPADDEEAFRASSNTFFTEWDEARHVVTPFEIPRHWRHFGAVDWGYGKPFCFGLAAMDEQGGVIQIGEVYGDRLLNRDQAARIRAKMEEHGLHPANVPLHCDPSMWNVKMTPDGVGYRDIDDYLRAGLACIPANNRRTGKVASGGWSNVRQYLHDDLTHPQTGETYPAFRVFRGCCPNLVRTLPLMVHDPNNPEDMDSTKEDHGADMLRYELSAWLRPSGPPARETNPQNRLLGITEDDSDSSGDAPRRLA